MALTVAGKLEPTDDNDVTMVKLCLGDVSTVIDEWTRDEGEAEFMLALLVVCKVLLNGIDDNVDNSSM